MYTDASPAQKHRPECSGQSGQRALVHVLYLIVDVQYSAERSAAALVHVLYLIGVCMHRSQCLIGTYAESSGASLVHCICYCMLTSKIRDLMSIIIQSAQEQL